MAITVALFNHKGGVSKTTTTFNLGWMLASKGHRVILVDADPQCNLTGVVLGWRGENEFDTYYQDEDSPNIRNGLAPAFESQPRVIESVDCLSVEGCDGLFVLPGHIRLSEYEVTLGIAQELSGTIQTLRNLPGSIYRLLSVTADAHNADIVLIDMNPSLSSINQNLLMTSDYFMVPTSPDFFSTMAIDSLSDVIPRWHRWSVQAQASPILRDAAYPFPEKSPKFLGTVIQKFRPRGGTPTVGFQHWIDSIGERVVTRLRPTLEGIGMMLPQDDYVNAGLNNQLCLALIADFNTLIALSQSSQTPVFALDDDVLGVGIVLEQNQRKREEFFECFSDLADRVLALTGMGDGA